MISYHQPTIFSLLTCQFHVTWKNLLSYFDLDNGECDPKNDGKKHRGEKLLETINLDLDDGEGDKQEDGKSEEGENYSRDGRALVPPEVFSRYFFRYSFQVYMRYSVWKSDNKIQKRFHLYLEKKIIL